MDPILKELQEIKFAARAIGWVLLIGLLFLYWK